MPDETTFEVLQELPQALVFAETDDVQSLASIHDLFQRLTTELQKEKKDY